MKFFLEWFTWKYQQSIISNYYAVYKQVPIIIFKSLGTKVALCFHYNAKYAKVNAVNEILDHVNTINQIKALKLELQFQVWCNTISDPENNPASGHCKELMMHEYNRIQLFIYYDALVHTSSLVINTLMNMIIE